LTANEEVEFTETDRERPDKDRTRGHR